MCTELWPAHAWFLEITFVLPSVSLCLVCVYAPDTINNYSGEMKPE